MPIYEYRCEACEHQFEVEQGVKEKPKKRCPKCRKHKLERLLFASLPSVRGNINTIGQLAESNTKKMGRYGLDPKNEKEEAERKHKKEIADKKEFNRKLNNLSPSGTEKYIKTGEL